jgi:riboflavin kinase/FMN adenylyltransferase
MTVVEGSWGPSAGADGFDRVRSRGPSVVAIGKFDGVHRGHQQLLVRTLAEARRRGLQPGVVTFDVHPAEVLHRRQHRYLTLRAERLALLAAAKMQFVVLLRSTPELFAMPPEAFVDALVAALDCKMIVVGANFRFGKGAAGTPDTLRSIGARHATRVVTQGLIPDNATVVSSTRIHRELAAGHVTDVAALLGRPFSVSGTLQVAGQESWTVTVPAEQALPVAGAYEGELALRDHDGQWTGRPVVVNTPSAGTWLTLDRLTDLPSVEPPRTVRLTFTASRRSDSDPGEATHAGSCTGQTPLSGQSGA